MSNVRPAGAGDRAWYVILHEGSEVGTVWLEKLPGAGGTVKLGILLGDEQYFGRGIGRRAVKLAIEKAGAVLDFRRVLLYVRRNNTRAVRCYRHCGFEIVREFSKATDSGQTVPAYEMVRELPLSEQGA